MLLRLAISLLPSIRVMLETVRLFSSGIVALRVITHLPARLKTILQSSTKTRKLHLFRSRAVKITMNKKDGKQILH